MELAEGFLNLLVICHSFILEYTVEVAGACLL